MEQGDAGRAAGWGALACGAFVLVAVVLEMVAGASAASPVPAWAADLAPLAWPRAGRVAWWVAVAAATAGFRLLLARAGVPGRRWVTVAAVAPFLVFAAGIAAGAGWATWH